VLTIPAPMQAPETLRQPFTDPEWLYELKFDGYRCMAGIEADDGFQPETDDERRLHIANRVVLFKKARTSYPSRRFSRTLSGAPVTRASSGVVALRW
jgi:hypothetical protein